MYYAEWLCEWFDNYVKPTAKSRTIGRYEEIIKLHIDPALGNYRLEELKPVILQRYVTKLLTSGNLKTGKNLSANSVNAIIGVMKNSLYTAFISGVSCEYYGDKIKKPQITEKGIECFTPEEQRKIEKAILGGKKTKLYGIVLCLYTGLRIGELLSLTWEDIDMQKGILTVSTSCHDGKNEEGVFGRITENPKTSSSKRMIPLPKQVLNLLRLMKKESTAPYIVSGKNKEISVRSYQRSFELLLKKLGLPHRGFHALRHTFATRALESGMDMKTLSEIMGHKSTHITLNRYVHSMPRHKRDMMNQLGKILSDF